MQCNPGVNRCVTGLICGLIIKGTIESFEATVWFRWEFDFGKHDIFKRKHWLFLKFSDSSAKCQNFQTIMPITIFKNFLSNVAKQLMFESEN